MSSITMYIDIVYTSKYHTNNKGVYIIPKNELRKKRTNIRNMNIYVRSVL